MLIQQLQRTVLIPSPSSVDTPSPRPDRRAYGRDELPACKHLACSFSGRRNPSSLLPIFHLISSISPATATPPPVEPSPKSGPVQSPPQAGQHQAMIHSCLENSASCLHQLSHLLSLSLPVPPLPALSRDLEPKHHHHTRFRQHPPTPRYHTHFPLVIPHDKSQTQCTQALQLSSSKRRYVRVFPCPLRSLCPTGAPAVSQVAHGTKAALANHPKSSFPLPNSHFSFDAPT
ncbi:hypothetical protein PCL_07918 [Purpureocillium lilacinum]|uniref:Uncharacterized protein n=1 Tax=Purpureocillium lilacinum TaxID=33203 RepID=A0A2U3EJB4_PURLI|nr:hypothetical protein PCL_07918 [Purpureocillium lilacinum]